MLGLYYLFVYICIYCKRNYNCLIREIQRKAKACKEKWIEDKCKEESDAQANPEKLFQSAQELCGTFSLKLQSVKDKNDKVLEKNNNEQMEKTF